MGSVPASCCSTSAFLWPVDRQSSISLVCWARASLRCRAASFHLWIRVKSRSQSWAWDWTSTARPHASCLVSVCVIVCSHALSIVAAPQHTSRWMLSCLMAGSPPGPRQSREDPCTAPCGVLVYLLQRLARVCSSRLTGTRV
jgi:hypothetical protein